MIQPYEERPVVREDPFDAFQLVGPEGLVLPSVVLVQGTSRIADPRRAGQFYNTVFEEYRERLSVAIFGVRQARALFREGDFDSPPLCSSPDGNVPNERVVVDGVETGPTCPACPFAQWGSARGGTGRGQACRLSLRLLCFDLTEEDTWGLFTLRVSGASIAPWRAFATRCQLRRMPSHAIETVVTSRMRRFDAGQAYVMEFRTGQPLPADVADAVRMAAQRYAETIAQADDEDVAAEIAQEEMAAETPTPEAPRPQPRGKHLFDLVDEEG